LFCRLTNNRGLDGPEMSVPPYASVTTMSAMDMADVYTRMLTQNHQTQHTAPRQRSRSRDRDTLRAQQSQQQQQQRATFSTPALSNPASLRGPSALENMRLARLQVMQSQQTISSHDSTDRTRQSSSSRQTQGQVSESTRTFHRQDAQHPFAKTMSFVRTLVLEMYVVNQGDILDMDSTSCSSIFKYGCLNPNQVTFVTPPRHATSLQHKLLQYRQQCERHLPEPDPVYSSRTYTSDLLNPNDMLANAPNNSLDAIVSLSGFQEFVTCPLFLQDWLRLCYNSLKPGGCMVGTALSGNMLEHFAHLHPSEQSKHNIRVSRVASTGSAVVSSSLETQTQFHPSESPYPSVTVHFPFYKSSRSAIILDNEFRDAAQSMGFEVQVWAPVSDFVIASAGTQEALRLKRCFKTNSHHGKTSTSHHNTGEMTGHASDNMLPKFFRVFVLRKV
jgi:hypothetical protein